MSNPEQPQPSLFGDELPDQPAAAQTVSEPLRPLGGDYEAEQAQRRAELAELRGEDLAKEQTGVSAAMQANATGYANPSRIRHPDRRPTSPRSGMDRDAARAEDHEIYANQNNLTGLVELSDEQRVVNAEGVAAARQAIADALNQPEQ